MSKFEDELEIIKLQSIKSVRSEKSMRSKYSSENQDFILKPTSN